MNNIKAEKSKDQQNNSENYSKSKSVNERPNTDKTKKTSKKKTKPFLGLSKSNWINLGLLIVGIITLLIIIPSKEMPEPLIQNIQHPSGWGLNEPYPFIVIIRNYGKATAYKVQPSNIKFFDKVVLDDSVFNTLVIDTTQSFNILPNSEQDITFSSNLIYTENINWDKIFLVGKFTYLDSEREKHTTKFAGWLIGDRIIPEINETD